MNPEEDAIIAVHDKWTGEDKFYDPDCAAANGIVGDVFYPDLEVQINGSLPSLTCDICGTTLIPDEE